MRLFALAISLTTAVAVGYRQLMNRQRGSAHSSDQSKILGSISFPTSHSIVCITAGLAGIAVAFRWHSQYYSRRLMPKQLLRVPTVQSSTDMKHAHAHAHSRSAQN